MTDVRKNTNALIELMDNDMLDSKRLVRDLLGFMSEADVKEFAEMNDYTPFIEAMECL